MAHQEENRRFAESMSVLYDMSLLVNSAKNRRDVLTIVLRQLAAIMPADRLWLYEESEAGLRCLDGLARNPDDGSLSGTAALPESLIRRIIKDALLDSVNDIRTILSPEEAESTDPELRSLNVTVMRGENSFRGCLVLGATSPAAYSHERSAALFMLSLQLVTVIKNLRLREEIETANRRLRLIFETIDEGLLLLDRTGRVLDINARAEKDFFPDMDSDARADFPGYLLANKKRYKAGIWRRQLRDWKQGQLDASELPLAFELVLRDRDAEDSEDTEHKESWPDAVQIEFIPIESGEQLLVLVRDISERKRADGLRRDLTAMLVHDLRSPLGIINWNMEMLLDGVLGEVNERQEKFLKGSVENSRELLDMVDSLLDIDRLESATLELDCSMVTIPEMAEKMVAHMEILSHQMNLSFETDFSDDFPEVEADPSLMRRVLFNLVFNAAKYSPPASTIRISGYYEPETDRVVFGVKDQGPGIPAKYLHSIFDKYVQVQARHKGEIKSKGLGLTFCKLAIEAHAGRIWVESEEGRGSFFKCALARKACQTAQLAD